MLHIISNLTPAILARVNTDDAILFLENALLTVLKNSVYQPQLLMFKQLYVLNNQLTERGILTEEILEHINVIDYARFVELTVEHYPIQSWT